MMTPPHPKSDFFLDYPPVLPGEHHTPSTFNPIIKTDYEVTVRISADKIKRLYHGQDDKPLPFSISLYVMYDEEHNGSTTAEDDRPHWIESEKSTLQEGFHVFNFNVHFHWVAKTYLKAEMFFQRRPNDLPQSYMTSHQTAMSPEFKPSNEREGTACPGRKCHLLHQ